MVIKISINVKMSWTIDNNIFIDNIYNIDIDNIFRTSQMDKNQIDLERRLFEIFEDRVENNSKILPPIGNGETAW